MSFLTGMLLAVGVIAFILTNVILFMWMEFKILAHIVDRLGPMETGKFHGWLQPIADVLKFLNKEDIVPAQADKLLFKLAPFVSFIPAFMALAAIPMTKNLYIMDTDIGVFYVIALSAFTFVGMVMAGWSSHNKYSLLGAFRAAGQLLSYELPMGLAIAGVAMAAGTLRLIGIVDYQTIPNIFVQPLGFIVFAIVAEAELTRSPFDLPQSESELITGYQTEYSGMRWALFFVAEYFSLIILASLISLLFLGGWHGPWLPPLAWFIIKIYVIFIFLVWVRGTLPRVRPDQLMALGWKVLIPAALINILLTGVLVILLPHSWKLWLGVSEIVIVLAGLYWFRRILP